jgi:predicted signal transduction protein with EAL and GGDEF domain
MSQFAASQDINVGIAGSLTMIVLCTAMVLLFMSFYRRYKRMQERQIPKETNIDFDELDELDKLDEGKKN